MYLDGRHLNPPVAGMVITPSGFCGQDRNAHFSIFAKLQAISDLYGGRIFPPRISDVTTRFEVVTPLLLPIVGIIQGLQSTPRPGATCDLRAFAPCRFARGREREALCHPLPCLLVGSDRTQDA
jgi:hypothetical protein